MLKRLLLVFIAVTVGTGAVAFFFLKQATYLPSWYTNQASNTQTSNTQAPQSDVEQNQKKLEREQVLEKLSQSLTDPNTRGEARLDAREVNALLETGLESTQDSQLVKAVKGTKTQISEGKISSGAVIDLNQIPVEKLPSKAQSSLKKLLDTVPTLKDHPLYIQVEGKPTVRNRQVILDDTTRVKLGNIGMTIPELSQRLGIPEEKLNRQLSKALLQLPSRVENVEVVGDRLVVRTVPNKR